MVTDGTAVLGLGNIGPLASLPVMEGKAVLFKRFAGIDAFPIALDTTDVDQIVETICAIAPVFAGINLEDISAPRCFEIERRLRERLDIPVFHDDQHGTAIVVVAALTNALKVVGKDLATVRIVLSGAGAAGTAVLKLLLAAGAKDVVVADIEGVVRARPAGPGRVAVLDRVDDEPARHHGHASPTRCGTPTCSSASPRRTSSRATTSRRWRRTRSCSRWPTPGPRSTRTTRPSTRRSSARAARTSPTRSTTCSRSRASSAGCSTRSRTGSPSAMLLAAAYALASVVTDDELNPTYIVPSVFNPEVTTVVAAAVTKAAQTPIEV